MLKIDLYNNHEVYIKERKTNWTTQRWLKKRGLDLEAITKDHPCWKDVILLLNFKQEFYAEYKTSSSLTKKFNNLWLHVYCHNSPLRLRNLNMLEAFGEECLEIRRRQQQQIQNIKYIRQHIATRQNQKIGCNMTANSPCPSQSKLVKGNPGDCREDPNAPPW